MAEQQQTDQRTDEQEVTGKIWKRRGILAAGAAVVAGIVAKQTSIPVAATNGNSTGSALIIGANPFSGNTANTSSQTTHLIFNGAATPVAAASGTAAVFQGADGGNASGVVGAADSHVFADGSTVETATGVYGQSKAGTGVHGLSLLSSVAAFQGGTGVIGEALNPGGTGVSGSGTYGVVGSGATGLYGSSSALAIDGVLTDFPIGPPAANTIAIRGTNYTAGSSGVGVSGRCDGPYGVGVVAESGSFVGLWGQTDSGTAILGDVKAGAAGASNTGVQGRVGAFGPNSQNNTFGIHGINQSTGTGGIGVRGDSTGGIGVLGVTSSATAGTAGVFGSTAVSHGSGLVGQVFGASTTGAAAFVGAAGSGNFAAFFTGDVHVNGKLVVGDPSYKSGMLKHATDGTNRLVYCVESPESWIEDVGKATLAGGKATVRFDADFAAVTRTDDYHVFLTEYGDDSGLYVANQTASGFEVHAKGNPTASGRFSWKVMVKALSTVKGERLGRYTPPTIRLPDKPLFDLAPPVVTTPTPLPAPAPSPAPRPPTTSAPVAPAVVPPASVPAPAPPSR